MTCSGPDNYSNIFYKTVFDDALDSEYDVTLMLGDLNVAPDHNMDTMGYLQTNNLNSRRFIDRMKSLNMLTDVFRHKHPELQQYNFGKKQTKNYTRARQGSLLRICDRYPYASTKKSEVTAGTGNLVPVTPRPLSFWP